MKQKEHTVYKLADGTTVPGVTTFLHVLNKPALVKWANNLGLQGINSNKYVDNLADAGTLGHHMIMSYLLGIPSDLTDYSDEQIALAKNSFKSFLTWYGSHDIKPILIETPLVSEDYRFGGTPDLIATVDGIPTLIDFKTSKALYPEHEVQVSAYCTLAWANGYLPQKATILRIGRDASEGFEIREVADLTSNFEVFTHCQAIYELQKKLRRKKK